VTNDLPTCYRHPDRETRLGCAACGRPICTECANETPVGFKCPECAAPRTKIVTARSLNRPPVVTTTILAINLGVFALTWLLPAAAFYLSQVNPLVLQGAWWRMVTGAFVHASVLHIFFNMYALWIFGPQIERQVGGGPFAALYAASLLWGGVVFLLIAPHATAVGASGAIFGLFGAWIGASYRARHTPAGRRMFQQLMVLLAINAALPLVIPAVAWQAHAGGLVAGLLIVLGWQKLARGSARRRLAVALAVAAIPVVVVLALVAVG
jgi:membrane associated rhomboid family serine protease